MTEYFISGAVDGGEYRTSLLVRMPSDPARFSGVVLMETVHTAGHITIWPGAWAYLTEHGHGYAKVISQKGALDGPVLQGQPDRYAALVIPAATKPLNGSGGFPPGMIRQFGKVDAEQSEMVRRMHQDVPNSLAIMAQAGSLLKTDDSIFGAPVRQLVMAGISQCGAQTIAFIEDAHPAAVLDDGRLVFDGFMPHAAFGDKPLPPSGVPIVHVVDEAEVRMPPLVHRRPDSDEGADLYRLFEIAGCPHVATRGMDREAVSTFFARVAGQESQGNLPPGVEPSQYPASMLYRALFRVFFDWVTEGITPPKASRLATDADDNLIFSEHGNAIGGVRNTCVDVPTAKYVGTFVGTQERFDTVTLRSLYGNEANYVAKVDASLDELTANRFLLSADAEELRAEAKSFTF